MMERRLCQAVGGRTRRRQLDTTEGRGAAWSWWPAQHWGIPTSLRAAQRCCPHTLPSYMIMKTGLTWSLTGHTQFESLVWNKNLLRGKSLGLNKNRFKNIIMKHHALFWAGKGHHWFQHTGKELEAGNSQHGGSGDVLHIISLSN